MMVGIFLLFILLFSFTFVRFNIEKFEINGIMLEKQTKLKAKIGLYLFNLIPIFQVKISNDFLKKHNKLSSRLRKSINLNSIRDLSMKNSISKLKINLEKLDLNISIGTGDVLLTSFIIPIISTLISIILNFTSFKLDYKNIYYRINPIFNTEDFSYKISLNCIISINLTQTIITLLTKNRIKTDFFTVSSPTQG